MTGVESAPMRLEKALMVLAAIGLLFRFWTSLCFFPLTDWNNVRLAPTFMAFFGSNPYPGVDDSPVTTWIYGPAPFLVNAPATLASSVVPALLIAGVITLFLAMASAIVGTKSAASQIPETAPGDCVWTIFLCLALWPNASLQYIQADNYAVAFGVLGNFWLLRSGPESKNRLWFAAICSALAVWSKQTAIGLIPAQLLWLGITSSTGIALYYGVACLTFGLALGGAFLVWFGFPGMWLNLVQIPGHLPFSSDWLGRSRDWWIQLSAYALLPAVACLAMRRTGWKKDSPWLLPTLTWLTLLPMSLISFYKIGGASNSLNALLYLLPVTALVFVQKIRGLGPVRGGVWLTVAVFFILIQQFKLMPLLPLRPATTALVEAEGLSRQLTHRLFFPWHPLVTFFNERRFYDSDDGYSTRQAAQLPFDRDRTKHSLPPHWALTAVPPWLQEGPYRLLQPADAKKGYNGKWVLYYWYPSDAPKKPE